MRLILTAFSILLLVQVAHAQSYGPPAYSVGDSWMVTVGKNTREIKVVKAEEGRFFIAGFYSGCPTCVVETDRNLTWLNLLDGDGKPVDVTKVGFAPLGADWKFYDFPLEVKKSWRISAQAYAGGGINDYTIDCRVIGYEDVKTLAGTFKAFRVQRDWHFRNRVGPQYDSRWTDVSWFAPDVNGAVKYTSTRRDAQDWELVSSSVKK